MSRQETVVTMQCPYDDCKAQTECFVMCEVAPQGITVFDEVHVCSSCERRFVSINGTCNIEIVAATIASEPKEVRCESQNISCD